MARLLLTDEEWNLIADVFPKPAATGRPARDPRQESKRGRSSSKRGRS